MQNSVQDQKLVIHVIPVFFFFFFLIREIYYPEFSYTHLNELFVY
jgi:hypothetical protein